MPNSLVDRLRAFVPEAARRDAREDRPKLFPPASTSDIAEAEVHLGFKLPAILRDIYLSVGNGGFGPSYGLLGVSAGAPDDRGFTAADCYLGLKKAFGSAWPDKLLPICYHGCGIYGCADCSNPKAPIVTWHPADLADDPVLWRTCFTEEAPSLRAWFERWMDEKPADETE
jgi:hypothetical protein